MSSSMGKKIDECIYVSGVSKKHTTRLRILGRVKMKIEIIMDSGLLRNSILKM